MIITREQAKYLMTKGWILDSVKVIKGWSYGIMKYGTMEHIYPIEPVY